LQGYGKALRDLAKANTEAPDTVERFKRPGGQGTT
jgi:hypothetical protein